MYKVLVFLMFAAAVKELDINISDFKNCHSRQCFLTLEMKARNVLKIYWDNIYFF